MEELDLIKVGEFITKLRKEKNLTQIQLAEKMIVSHKTISKWENGNGFPDYLYQKKLCNIFNITIEELHNGRIDEEKRRKNKNNKILLRSATCGYILLVPILLSLLLFFLTTYNSLKIYSIMQGKDYEGAIHVKGIFIDSKQLKMIYIGNISFLKDLVNENDIISVDIYSGNKMIYHANVLNNIITIFEKNSNIDLKNISMIVEIKKHGEQCISYEVPLTSTLLLVKKPILDATALSNENQTQKIINNIEEKGFKKMNNNTWKKELDKEKSLTVYPLISKIIYAETSDDFFKNYSYYYKDNYIEVYIYHIENNVHTLIEKYKYNYTNRKIDCQVGLCTTKDEIIKLMNKYINLLNVE